MRRILPAVIGLLLLGACSDLPTSPADLAEAAAGSLDEAAGCVSDGTCVLEPIVVGPGDCDPSYEDCGGDTCQESTPGTPDTSGTESCPGWGGGGDGIGDDGPGGGGTSPGDGDDEPLPPPCPDWDQDCVPSHPPEGVDEEYWSRLNDTERRMCWANPQECIQVFHAANEASGWAAQQDPVGAHNGPQDAMRHAYWNARLTKFMGYTRAAAWANAHEESSTDPAETRMDLHNNAVGRDIGLFLTDIGEGVWRARNNGKLCLWVGQC